MGNGADYAARGPVVERTALGDERPNRCNRCFGQGIFVARHSNHVLPPSRSYSQYTTFLARVPPGLLYPTLSVTIIASTEPSNERGNAVQWISIVTAAVVIASGFPTVVEAGCNN